MEHKHLDAAAMERLLTVDRSTEQNEQLFHLLAVCPSCHEVGGFADLAVHVADLLPGSAPFEEPWIYQLRALAWAALGNARRVQGDLSGAERGFEMSDSWWAAGTGSTGDILGYEPILLDFKAPLRTVQRRFPEALKLLDQAVALFLDGQPEHRDPHLAGRSLISKAYVLIEMGSSESAIEVLKKADGWIDPERDPRLVLCVRHNLVDNLSKMGRHAEAADLLPDLRALAATQGSALDRLRLTWVEGPRDRCQALRSFGASPNTVRLAGFGGPSPPGPIGANFGRGSVLAFVGAVHGMPSGTPCGRPGWAAVADQGKLLQGGHAGCLRHPADRPYENLGVP